MASGQWLEDLTVASHRIGWAIWENRPTLGSDFGKSLYCELAREEPDWVVNYTGARQWAQEFQQAKIVRPMLCTTWIVMGVSRGAGHAAQRGAL